MIIYTKNKKRDEPEKLNSFDETILNTVDFTNHKFNSLQKNVSKFSTKKYISNINWLLTNDKNNHEVLYTFLDDNKLLITTNGIVKKCFYEIIVDKNSITIELDGVNELYDIINMKDNLLYLYKISSKEDLCFINQAKVKDLLIENI